MELKRAPTGHCLSTFTMNVQKWAQWNHFLRDMSQQWVPSALPECSLLTVELLCVCLPLRLGSEFDLSFEEIFIFKSSFSCLTWANSLLSWTKSLNVLLCPAAAVALLKEKSSSNTSSIWSCNASLILSESANARRSFVFSSFRSWMFLLRSASCSCRVVLSACSLTRRLRRLTISSSCCLCPDSDRSLWARSNRNCSSLFFCWVYKQNEPYNNHCICIGPGIAAVAFDSR